MYDEVRGKKSIPLKSLQQNVGLLLEEVQRLPLVLPVPDTTTDANLRPYTHTVNVTLMSLQTGKELGYNSLMLRDLAVGCLLHDIGKAVTEEESKHPEAGFSLIRQMREISLLSAHVAYQHHESLDGTGYPRKIDGGAFLEYAQVCGLCNYYDHMVADTPPHEAMEVVMGSAVVRYNAEIVEAFVRSVPAYPPGSKIRLQGGEAAIVTKITSHMQRPVVRIISTGEEISLAEQTTVMIAGYGE